VKTSHASSFIVLKLKKKAKEAMRIERCTVTEMKRESPTSASPLLFFRKLQPRVGADADEYSCRHARTHAECANVSETSKRLD
jgi:hypothetical protein